MCRRIRVAHRIDLCHFPRSSSATCDIWKELLHELRTLNFPRRSPRKQCAHPPAAIHNIHFGLEISSLLVVVPDLFFDHPVLLYRLSIFLFVGKIWGDRTSTRSCIFVKFTLYTLALAGSARSVAAHRIRDGVTSNPKLI
jgi:hypothetical protein